MNPIRLKTCAMAVLAAIAVSVSATSAAAAPDETRYAAPSQVWVIGSDIETEAHTRTLQLRDALGRQIADNRSMTQGIATAIYIPDDVRLLKAGFQYRVLLIDSDRKTLKSTDGRCRGEVSACAKAIMSSLEAVR